MSIVIRLEELGRSDFDIIRDWIDPRVFRKFHEPIDDEQLGLLLSRHEEGRPVSLGYRIAREQDGSPVGLLHSVVDWNNHLMHIGQMIVGDAASRGQGIGQAALRLLLPICFDELGLHRAQLFVDEDNARAIACYRKVGFQIEGLMREAARTDAGYVSWHSMSLLEDEWRPRTNT